MPLVVAKRVVIAQIQVPGVHYWEGAPEAVGFLRNPHRHVFTIRGEWVVDQPDREVEFFIAQSWLRTAVAYEWPSKVSSLVPFGPMSCEMIATRIGELFDLMPQNGFAQKPRAPSAVEVHEDDEDGSRVEFAIT